MLRRWPSQTGNGRPRKSRAIYLPSSATRPGLRGQDYRRGFPYGSVILAPPRYWQLVTLPPINGGGSSPEHGAINIIEGRR
jgi:hypothetical protein